MQDSNHHIEDQGAQQGITKCPVVQQVLVMIIILLFIIINILEVDDSSSNARKAHDEVKESSQKAFHTLRRLSVHEFQHYMEKNFNCQKLCMVVSIR